MRNVWLYSFYQLRMVVKEWKVTLTILFVPIIFILGVWFLLHQLMASEERVQQFRVAIVDQDKTLETKYVIQQLVDSEHLKNLIEPIQVDREQAEEWIKDNKIAAMIILPQGFSHDVKRGINTPVEVIGNEQRPIQSILVRYLMESAAHATSAAQSGINTISHFLREADVPVEQRREAFKKSLLSFSLHTLGRGEIFEVEKKESLYLQNMVLYYVFSFSLLLLLIWTFGFLFLLEGQTNRAVRDRLLTRGVAKWQMKLASLLSMLLLLLPLFFLMVITFASYLQLLEPEEYTGLVLPLFMIVLLYSSFFITLYTIFRTERLYLLVGFITIIFGSMAGGYFIPPVYFPTWLEEIGTYTVQSWSLKLFLSAFSYHTGSAIGEYIKQTGFINIGLMLLFLFMSGVVGRRWRWS